VKIGEAEVLPVQPSTVRSSALDVKYETTAVSLVIDGPNSEGDVTEGETVTISCSGDGNPAPVVIISGPNTVRSFMAAASDSGVYTCTYNDITDSKSLNVQYITQPTASVSAVTAEVGGSVSQTCSAQGNPAPTIEWFGPGDVKISDTGSLEIGNVQKSHAGSYTCKASNKVNTLTTGLTIGVQYGCSATLDYKVSYSTEGGGKGHVELTCTSDGDPTCKVTISGNGCEDAEGLASATCTVPALEPQATPPKVP
jgi:hypothetical protein